MPTRSLRRMAAPLLVVAGCALFAAGAGGIARVDDELDAATRPAPQPPPQAQPRHDLGVRGDRPRSHHREF